MRHSHSYGKLAMEGTLFLFVLFVSGCLSQEFTPSEIYPWDDGHNSGFSTPDSPTRARTVDLGFAVQNSTDRYPWEDENLNLPGNPTTTRAPTNDLAPPIPSGIFPWEDDYDSGNVSPITTSRPTTTTSRPTTTTRVPASELVPSPPSGIFPWEDDYPPENIPEITTSRPTTTRRPSSDSAPPIPSVVFPWEDDYPAGSYPQPTSRPTLIPITSPTTTYWSAEPWERPATKPPTLNGQTTTNDLFTTSTRPLYSPIQYQDPCRNLGIIRRIICLSRYFNPAIGFSFSTG